MAKTGAGDRDTTWTGVYFSDPTPKQKISEGVLEDLCWKAQVCCVSMHPCVFQHMHDVLAGETRKHMIDALTVASDDLNKKGIKPCVEFQRIMDNVTSDALYAECVERGIFPSTTAPFTHTQPTSSS
jgi:hypothetical protein